MAGHADAARAGCADAQVRFDEDDIHRNKENVTMLRNIGIAVAAIIALVVAGGPAARGAEKQAEPADAPDDGLKSTQ